MKIISLAAASAAMAFAAIPFASPAAAQGATAPVTRVGTACPSGYSQGSTAQRSKPNPNQCYPDSSSSPAVYVKNGACAQGYRAEFGYCTSKADGAVYTDPTFGNIAKARELDRCPVGYHTNEENMMSCVSFDYAAGKQPATRPKKGPCAADEVDEWGLWCTSKSTALNRVEAEQEAAADVTRLYMRDGKGGNQGEGESTNTPGILAIFGPKGGKAAASSAAASSDDQAAAPATQQTAQCTTDNGSATGAAIGGAVGGDAGAVLGSVLGGLGKKKKKKGC